MSVTLARNFLNESGTSAIRIFKKFICNCHLCGNSSLFSGDNSDYELVALSFSFLLFISTSYIEPFHLLTSLSISGVREEIK